MLQGVRMYLGEANARVQCRSSSNSWNSEIRPCQFRSFLIPYLFYSLLLLPCYFELLQLHRRKWIWEAFCFDKWGTCNVRKNYYCYLLSYCFLLRVTLLYNLCSFLLLWIFFNHSCQYETFLANNRSTCLQNFTKVICSSILVFL